MRFLRKNTKLNKKNNLTKSKAPHKLLQSNVKES